MRKEKYQYINLPKRFRGDQHRFIAEVLVELEKDLLLQAELIYHG